MWKRNTCGEDPRQRHRDEADIRLPLALSTRGKNEPMKQAAHQRQDDPLDGTRAAGAGSLPGPGEFFVPQNGVKAMGQRGGDGGSRNERAAAEQQRPVPADPAAKARVVPTTIATPIPTGNATAMPTPRWPTSGSCCPG